MTKRSHPNKKKWDIDFKNSSIVSAEALMRSSQKELWKPEIPFRRRTGAQRRKREAANIHRLVPAPGRQSARTRTHTCRWSGKHTIKKCGLFMSLLYYWTAGLKYIEQNTHTLTNTEGLAGRLIDVIHCSALGTVTPSSALTNRGAAGGTLVTPSGRGLAKTQSQRERIKKKRQTTHQQQHFQLDNPQLGPIVSHLSQSEKLAFVIEGCLSSVWA